jgi:hypothetical protein
MTTFMWRFDGLTAPTTSLGEKKSNRRQDFRARDQETIKEGALQNVEVSGHGCP